LVVFNTDGSRTIIRQIEGGGTKFGVRNPHPINDNFLTIEIKRNEEVSG